MKRKRCLVAGMAVILALMLLAAAPAQAESYKNYVYDSQGEAQAEPQAYRPTERITGQSLGVGTFNSPKNVYVAEDETIYIVDTGNDRIVTMTPDGKLGQVIDSFIRDGQQETFSKPESVFLTEEALYVADTGNARLVVLERKTGNARVLERPRSALLSEDFSYQPVDVAVDSAGRIFVISANVYDGVMELTPEGEFVGFMGAVKVKRTLLQALWRTIASREQREQMQLYLPTEYAAVDIDESGFLYCTVSAIDADNYSEDMFVCRLNPMGNDILKRNGFQPPMGDVEVRTNEETMENEYSSLVDVSVQDCGVYSLLDQRMGRIFTYDSNGQLMYVFGALGDREGQFGMPETLDTLSDGRILVADSTYNWIAVFEPTAYGEIITGAVKSFYNRQYEQTDTLWEQALRYTAKSNLAFDGIGRSRLKSGEYRQAMEYLRAASDYANYSSALEKYRSQVLNRAFNGIVIGLAVCTVGAVVWHWRRKWRKGERL